MRQTREQLEQELLQIASEIQVVEAQLKPIQRDLSRLQSEEIDVRAKLVSMRKQPHLSDHAVIRYLERIYGFSFEDIRAEIMTPTTIAAIDAGANAVKVNGAKFVVKDKTIVTCHG